MNLTPDTVQELTAGEHIKSMTEGYGWALVKARLDEKIVDLQMIGNVTGTTPQEKVTNMEARAMAVHILFEWLKNDVYGRVEQQDVSKAALLDTTTDSHIIRE